MTIERHVRRGKQAALLVVVGLVLVVAGVVWYAQSTSTSVEDEAADAAGALAALQCAQDGVGCDEAAASSSDREEPARLAVAGLGAALVLAGVVVGVGSRDAR